MGDWKKYHNNPVALYMISGVLFCFVFLKKSKTFRSLWFILQKVPFSEVGILLSGRTNQTKR